ncbi:MAG: glycosyltransferase [Tepidisphaeraceae bacterium]
MTVTQSTPPPPHKPTRSGESPKAMLAGSRKRALEAPSNRVRRDGRFFRLGGEKFCVKGVTYGPFAPNSAGESLPSQEQTKADFELIRELGANCVRIYHNPPKWFLDLADSFGIKVFLDVAWAKNLVFSEDHKLMDDAREKVRAAARECGNHPAIFAISVVNEVPADLVRYIGPDFIGDFIDELVEIVKAEAPDCLVTFANYPTTEYLQPRDVDFITFNVYLHEEQSLRNYLTRLHHVAGEKPLVLGEYGVDTQKEGTEEQQASILPRQIAAAYDEGVAGAFVFAFTDDWFVHGWQIDDWSFGLTRRDRSKKPAFDGIKDVFAKAPQTTSLKLPKVSVIVCSYNGASTTESCLRSMERIRYPDFEVVFVDDGSTDNTQEIVSKFPWVVNVKQKNMGLSFARNVGMQKATGEIIVYTDSDCEADEDWLYYLVQPMIKGFIGAGGPNLIPDEGSWVADCVGLSPGGPTHVMINDREAEHVPGCNMGYWRWAALEVKGFDAQFRKAGDDVDFIWRLQHRGHAIGFAPAAQVWHYRRNTVKAYLKQQRGYGEAEALLKYKHPDHFNTLGSGLWRRRIYGADIGIRFGGDVIYHGVFGTGLFQTIYRRPASMLAMMAMSVEWHLLTLFIALCGVAYWPLIYVAVFMILVPIVLAVIASQQARMPTKRRHWLMRPLIAFLHLRQPITRGLARYTVRLKAKSLRPEAVGFPRERLPFNPENSRELMYWTDSNQPRDRLQLLESIKREVEADGLRYRIDAGWHDWDLEIYGSRYAKVRLTTVSEKHDAGLMTRVKVEMLTTTFCKVLMVGAIILAAFIGWTLWPFSRPSLLIPMVIWTMFLMTRWRVGRPVLGLIDEAAEKAGFYHGVKSEK